MRIRHWMSLSASLLVAPASAFNEPAKLTAGAQFGPNTAMSAYLDFSLGGSSRLLVGKGESLDLAGTFVFLSETDRVRFSWLSYLHVAAEHGTRPEFSIGAMRASRHYDGFFGSSRDFTAETSLLVASGGIRTTSVGSAWVWRAGISASYADEHGEARVFDDDLSLGAYVSVGFGF